MIQKAATKMTVHPVSAAQEQNRRKTLPQLFKPGQSGNPAGRRPGSRNKLTENLLSDLAEFYQQEGKDLIRRVSAENPTALLQAIMKLIPREVELSSNTVNVEWTPDQRKRIAECWLMSTADAAAPDGANAGALGNG